MRYHPRAFAWLGAVLLIVVGCTADPPPSPSSAGSQINAPAPPADVFPGLSDRDKGVSTTVEAMAGDNKTLLMVATVTGRVSVPLLRSSSDGGKTWHDGQLSDRAAVATAVGEHALGVEAVARIGGGRRWLAMGEADNAPHGPVATPSTGNDRRSPESSRTATTSQVWPA